MQTYADFVDQIELNNATMSKSEKLKELYEELDITGTLSQLRYAIVDPAISEKITDKDIIDIKSLMLSFQSDGDKLLNQLYAK